MPKSNNDKRHKWVGNCFWQRCFYSGAASASATGAAGGSDLEGLLSVSMGSSGFSSAAAASIASSEASTTSAGAFSSAGGEELVTGATSAAATASSSATTWCSVEATGSSLVFSSVAASTGASASMLATSFTCSAFFSSSAKVSCSLFCLTSNWETLDFSSSF